MCVSTELAQFAGTTIYLGRKNHPAYGQVFVLGYQNRAINLSEGPNAMLLHFSALGMTQKTFLGPVSARAFSLMTDHLYAAGNTAGSRLAQWWCFTDLSLFARGSCQALSLTRLSDRLFAFNAFSLHGL